VCRNGLTEINAPTARTVIIPFCTDWDSATAVEDGAMKSLFIVNDPPYGSERCYNALRMAHALLKKDPGAEVLIFLMADAVVAAKAGQKTPDGYYNVERMLKRMLTGKGKVLLCGTCMDARGLLETEIMPGAQRSTMDELATATMEADMVMVF
jgi:uncharacterized protein involved in oxidation of intracellular sulfur